MPAKTFTTKISHVRIHLSPFTSEQMAGLAESVLTHIKTRIESVVDVNDNPAKPLSAKYAARKPKYFGGLPVRNWTWSGKTLRSLKVKSANENRAVIGFITQDAIRVVNGISKYGAMWGISPKDHEYFLTQLRTMVDESMRFAWVKTGQHAA